MEHDLSRKIGRQTLNQEDQSTDWDSVAALAGHEQQQKQRQEQVSKKTRREIAIAEVEMQGGLAWEYNGHGEYPPEVNDIYAMTKDSRKREFIAAEVAAGEFTVSDDVLRHLALDWKLTDSVKLELMDLPQYEEELPPSEEYQKNSLALKTRDYSADPEYDEYGDKWYRGYIEENGEEHFGEREFILGGRGVLSDSARGVMDRYGNCIEVDFTTCLSAKDFCDFCKSHKEAFQILIHNKEFYRSFDALQQRVQIIEDAIEDAKEKAQDPFERFSEYDSEDPKFESLHRGH